MNALDTQPDDRELRSATGSTSLPLGERGESWDAGAARKALDPSDYPKAFFWRDPNGDPKTLAAYKLPFASPSGGLHAVWAGVTAAAARLGSAQIPSSDVAGVKAKISAYYTAAAKKYNDEEIEVPWQTGDESESSAARAFEFRYAVAPVTGVEVRDPTGNDDNTWTMSGYAAVFNKKTTLYDGRFLKLTESINGRAFDNVLASQRMDSPDGVVHFNFGHDMNRAVAATDVPPGQPGSLTLQSHAEGLYFLARVPRDDPDGVAMAAKMRSGVLRQASFAFTVPPGGDERTVTEHDDGTEEEHRELLEIKHLYDVCATPQGAYPQTIAGLRSYAAALGQPPMGEATLVNQPDREPDIREQDGGENDVSPMGGIADLKARRVQADIARARSRYPKR